jgi:hypothetical protein
MFVIGKPAEPKAGGPIDDVGENHVFFHDNIVLRDSIKESVWLYP